MPDVAQQIWEERHDDQNTIVGWRIQGPTTPQAVTTVLMGVVPPAYDYRVLNKLESLDLAEGRTDLWLARVRYSMYVEKRDLKTGEMEFRFQTSGLQVRRTVSISSRVFDAAGPVNDAVDAQLIRFKRPKGPAEGVLVDETAYSFGWTVMLPVATATEFWRRSVGELRGTTNSGPFFGYQPNEVKFDDWSGSARGRDDYRVVLQFSRRPAAASLNVGGINVTDVGGWEYIDADEVKFLTDSKNRLIPQVERVKIHQVYPSASWALLSILLGV